MKSISILLVLVCCSFSALAQAPRTISYQGVLTDAAGTPIPDGQHQIKIALYDSNTAFTPIFSETLMVTTSKGIFSIILGSVTPIPAFLDFNRTYYLGTTVENGSELSPRTAFTAVPYAIHAEKAESASTASVANALAAGATGVVTSVNGAEGALTLQGGGGTTIARTGNTITVSSTGGSASGITGVQNTDGTLTIANPNGPVATFGVADNGITSGKLADGAVTTPKIGDGMVTSEKLGVNSVNAIHLMMNSVTNDKLENQAVTTPKIGDGAVTTNTIADWSVTPSKLNTSGANIGNVLTFNGSSAAWSPLPPVEGFSLPFADTVDASFPAMYLFNTAGNGIWSMTNNDRIGVIGVSGASFMIPLVSTGCGVYGFSSDKEGVVGNSNNGLGVIGRSTNNNAAEFSIVNPANSKEAVVVSTSGTGAALKATSSQGATIKATAGSGHAGDFLSFGALSTVKILNGSTGNGLEIASQGVAISASSSGGITGFVANTGTGTALSITSQSGTAATLSSQTGLGLYVTAGGANIIEARGGTNLRFRVLQDGNVRCDGAFTGGGADVAEAFDMEGTKADYEPGDVLVISPASDSKIMKCSSPNSTAVAGVYATKPGVILASTDAETDIESLVPMGIVGVIPTKVCSENGVIRRGDLLVTSSTPGHAMKAIPVVVSGIVIYPVGAILGKALENFDTSGTGMIKVLVNVK